jgi:hypothetical protein
MPRRHRSARERERSGEDLERPRGVAPRWAQVEGTVVRAVSGESGKTYRCPGCQQEIRRGTPHLVVVTEGNVEGRRHWHTSCWRYELRHTS